MTIINRVLIGHSLKWYHWVLTKRNKLETNHFVFKQNGSLDSREMAYFEMKLDFIQIKIWSRRSAKNINQTFGKIGQNQKIVI